MNSKTGFIILFLLFIGFTTRVSAAELLFSPTDLKLKVGQSQTVTLTLLPEGQETIGVDAFIRFDPTYISVVDIKSRGVFANQLGTQIAAGLAKFALANNYGIYQDQETEIAELTIAGIKETSLTVLTFDFVSGKTQDTNVVVSRGKDVLTQVNAVSITVTKADSAVKADSPAAPASSAQPAAGSSPHKAIASPKTVVTTRFPGVISPLSDVETGIGRRTDNDVLGEAKEPIEFDFTPARTESFLWLWLLLGGLAWLFIVIRTLKNNLLEREEKPQST